MWVRLLIKMNIPVKSIKTGVQQGQTERSRALWRSSSSKLPAPESTACHSASWVISRWSTFSDLVLPQHEVKGSQAWHSVAAVLSHSPIFLHFLGFSSFITFPPNSCPTFPPPPPPPPPPYSSSETHREIAEKLRVDEKSLHFWSLTAGIWHDVWIESATCDIVERRGQSALSVLGGFTLGTDTRRIYHNMLFGKVSENEDDILRDDMFCFDRANIRNAWQTVPLYYIL